MPLKPFCDDCGKELHEKPSIAIPHMVIRESDSRQGEARSLFFCDHKCLSSFVIKNTNRPTILGPAG